MLELDVNSHRYEIRSSVGTTLAEALRDELALTGTKVACGEGHCGACTVLVDGAPTLSCITLAPSGAERARGEVQYTADIRLNGMLHTAVLRSPHASARARSIDLAPALAMPGVHAAIGPGDIPQLVDDCNYQGHAVAAVCADSYAQARAAVAAIDVEWDVREPLLDPDEAVRRGSFLSDTRVRERGDFERALAEADVVVSGEYRTSV